MEEIIYEQQGAEEYEVFDECYGVITGRCQKGAFIRLENGQDAFAYRYANLMPGTEVLCSVLRKAREGLRMLVTVSHICQYAEAAA